jgi:hypothetical protein
MSCQFCVGCLLPRARVSRCRCCRRKVCAKCLLEPARRKLGRLLRVYVAERGCCEACAVECIVQARLASWSQCADTTASSASTSSWSPVAKQ